MGLLTGKNALIFGLANDKSIAWGITKAFHEQGANIGLSYAGEMLEKRVKPLAEQLGIKFVEECDVSSDEQITAVAEKAAKHFGQVDIIVHSIGFANKEELQGNFYDTSRAGFPILAGLNAVRWHIGNAGSAFSGLHASSSAWNSSRMNSMALLWRVGSPA